MYARFGVAAQPAMVIIAPDGGTRQVFGAVDDRSLDELLTDATS